MQYTTIVLAALGAVSALPGARKGHHHRRHAEAQPGYDVSNVNWDEALANVDWSEVFGGAAKTTVVAQTTTVAVAAPYVAPTTSVAAAGGNVASQSVNGRPAVVTNVPVVATTSAAAPAATSVAATPQAAASGDEYTINVINNCPYTIWQAGWQTNTAGALISSQVKGNEMSAGGSLSLAIPKAAMGVQIWARTGCTGSGSSFHCSVGDCQGLQCTSIIWQGGPIMAEFGSGLNTDIYNTGITAYDISAIPGNNVGAKIVPSKSSCETKYCPVSGCSTDQAWLSADDTSLGSPADTTCSNDTNFTVTFCPS